MPDSPDHRPDDRPDPGDTSHVAVSDYLYETMADLHPDVHRLVTGAVTRGRRIRRRRRIRTAAVAAAAVVVVAGGSAIAPRLLESGGTDPGPSDPPSASAKPTPAPSTDPAPTPARQPEVTIAAEELGSLVTDLYGGTAQILPPSATNGNDETGGDANERRSSITWNGYGMTISAERTSAAAAEAACSPDQGVEVTCTERPDGSTETSWTDGGGGRAVARAAGLIGPQWTLEVIAYNTTGIGDGDVITPQPTLTLAQLRRIVDSDGWYR